MKLIPVCVCVFVHVCLEINELAVRHHFEECGSVEAVRLIRDPSSGLGKGFGYVLFQVRPQTHKSLFTVTVEGSNLSVSSLPAEWRLGAAGTETGWHQARGQGSQG